MRLEEDKSKLKFCYVTSLRFIKKYILLLTKTMLLHSIHPVPSMNFFSFLYAMDLGLHHQLEIKECLRLAIE